MANELSVMMSVTPYSVARVKSAQRFETMLAQARATNGDRTQITKRTRRKRGVRSLARNIKPSDPAAPAPTAIRASARKRRRSSPSFLSKPELEFIVLISNLRPPTSDSLAAWLLIEADDVSSRVAETRGDFRRVGANGLHKLAAVGDERVNRLGHAIDHDVNE
jgi:hypothetical protein